MSREDDESWAEYGRREGSGTDWVNWIVTAVVVGIVGVYAYRFVAPSGAASLVGKEAPGFEVAALDEGESVRLTEYRGRVVLMDFWATWCPPCHDQMRYVKQFAGSHPDPDGPVVLLVNTDKPGANRRKKVESYLKRRGVTHPTALDDGTIQSSYRVDVYPTLVVVGPEGKIQFAEEGVHGPEELHEIVEAARE